jgi:hypothetical protein
MKVLLLDAYNLIYRARSGYLKGDYPVVYNFFRSLSLEQLLTMHTKQIDLIMIGTFMNKKHRLYL